jgi:hypothetical protein
MMGTIRDPDDPSDKPKANISSRITSFLGSGKAQSAVHSAASKAFDTVKSSHKHLITTAIAMSLTHVAPHHADVVLNNPDLEDHIHHQIEHLSQNLSVTKSMAHGMLTHAVGKLKEMRGIKEDQDKDDELDSNLIKLHKLLKKLEPHYNPKSPKEEPKPKSQGEPK